MPTNPDDQPPFNLPALEALYRAAKIKYDDNGVIWSTTARDLLAALPTFFVAFRAMQATDHGVNPSWQGNVSDHD